MASWKLGGLLGNNELSVTSCPEKHLALTNKVFVNPSDFASVTKLAQLKSNTAKFVYRVESNSKVPSGSIGLNSIQRSELRVALNDPLPYTPFSTGRNARPAAAANFEVNLVRPKGRAELEVEADDLLAQCRRGLTGHVATPGQLFLMDYFGTSLALKVSTVVSEGGSEVAEIVEATEFYFSKSPGSMVKVKGGAAARKEVFRPDFNFEKMGIGGLDKEFSDIFRRAFASRVFPPSAITKLGIQHVKGMLLYGPPGTGKTLIARQIGKMLNGKEPKVINGPEILNKFVGQSEENVRNLFVDAEKDAAENGDASELHIIIFDEIDAICKQRGSTGNSTGVHDTVVNQLLSKIDGVNALNNILVIGMTNRKDMIDEALLRPGRLEVHVEISLPDEHGRQQILRIHTAKMSASKMLGEDVDIGALAASTKNYSGAEIEGLCKSAAAFALNRHVDYKDLQKKVDTTGLVVTMDDFEHALVEVQPAFGMGRDSFARCLLGGFLVHGERTQELLSAGKLFRNEVSRSTRSPLVSVLIEGRPGTGKTALAALLAVESGFPFVRLISPESYVGYSEPAKCAAIAKAFDDAHKSPLSVIVLDDIERMIEYTPIGPRFSNIVLQTLMILCKQAPPNGRRLLILATTSSSDVLQQLDFRRSFSAFLQTETLNEAEIGAILSGRAKELDVTKALGQVSGVVLAKEPFQAKFRNSSERDTALSLLAAERLAIKKMLMVLHMSREELEDGSHYVDIGRLTQILRDVI